MQFHIIPRAVSADDQRVLAEIKAGRFRPTVTRRERPPIAPAAPRSPRPSHLGDRRWDGLTLPGYARPRF
jgi:hypothetical protein